MRSLPDRGRHLSLPETNLGAPPPSPPLIHGHPLCGALCGHATVSKQPLPLCGVIRVSHHGPVCTVCKKERFLSLWVSRGGPWWTVHHGIASLLLSHQQAAVGCQRALLLPSHEEDSGECYAAHLDPAPCRHRPWVGSLCSTSLPHHGYVGDSVGATGTVSRSLASAPQSVSVAPSDSATRFSSPGAPPSSGASGSLLSRPSMPLSCMRKSQSYWWRMR